MAHQRANRAGTRGPGLGLSSRAEECTSRGNGLGHAAGRPVPRWDDARAMAGVSAGPARRAAAARRALAGAVAGAALYGDRLTGSLRSEANGIPSATGSRRSGRGCTRIRVKAETNHGRPDAALEANAGYASAGRTGRTDGPAAAWRFADYPRPHEPPWAVHGAIPAKPASSASATAGTAGYPRARRLERGATVDYATTGARLSGV